MVVTDRSDSADTLLRDALIRTQFAEKSILALLPFTLTALYLIVITDQILSNQQYIKSTYYSAISNAFALTRGNP